MLKNKFKLIAILSVIILTLTLPIVRAENETADNTATTDVTASNNTSNGSEDPANPNNNEKADENFKKGDVYLSGENITVDYIIDGNLFITAKNVTINSRIGGDAFICAETITIEEQGSIFSNLFAFAKNVQVNGVAYDVYSFSSENTTISGYVYRDIRVASKTVNILGTIGRNAHINCSELNFTQDNNGNEEEGNTIVSQAVINGNLSYSSKNEISIPEGIVSGETTFEPHITFHQKTIPEYFMNLGTFVTTVMIIWLLCLWIAPQFLKNNTSFLTTKKVLPVIGFGILTPIVIVLLTILSFILGITSTISILCMLILFVLLVISSSMFVITLNTMICNKLKIEKNIGIFGLLVLCSIVLWLIGLIPYVGSIINGIVILFGIGITISSLLLKEKDVQE